MDGNYRHAKDEMNRQGVAIDNKWYIVVWGSWPPLEYDNEADAMLEARKLRVAGVPWVRVQKGYPYRRMGKDE